MNDWRGALAQLGERYNGIVEVSGSIPLGSTIRLNFRAVTAHTTKPDSPEFATLADEFSSAGVFRV